VKVPYFLERYDADASRFYLTAAARETSDNGFSWEDVVEHNGYLSTPPGLERHNLLI
jgi:methionyl-tRNA synthetase